MRITKFARSCVRLEQGGRAFSGYHPGDSLDLPGQPVETLFVPVHAAWSKTEEAIDFVKAAQPRRAFQIHDGQLNEHGIEGVNSWFAEILGDGYRYLHPRQTVD